MQTDLIIVREYCQKCHIDPSFIVSLEEGGLIEVQLLEGERYLLTSQLRDLERFVRWYYDLSVNIEGISVIQDLLGRMHDMKYEMNRLKRELQILRHGDKSYMDEYLKMGE